MARVLAILVALTVIGGVLRFDAAADPSRYQSKDEQSYAMLARWLVVHHEYGHPGMTDPAHWPPGAPLLFAVAYRVHPETRNDGAGVWDVPAAYPVQAFVGTLTIPAAFLLGLLVAGSVAGLVAAGAVAVYPPLIGASGDLLSEPLGALLVTAALAATVWALQSIRPSRLMLAGALLGATVLTRADLALVPVIALAVVLVVTWRSAESRRPLKTGVALLFMGGALLAVVLPWTIVASNVTGRFVPLSSGGASNLWVGTYLPGNGSMFGAKRALADEVRARRPDLADRQWFQLRQADVIAAVAARHPDKTTEAALGAEARENIRRYALGDPISFAGMAVDKIERLWGGYTVGTYRNARGWITALHLTLVALAALGLVTALVRDRRRPELWLIALVLLYVTALNAILVSEARHNLTLMPTVAVAAGCAVAVVAPWLWRGPLGRRAGRWRPAGAGGGG
jgi:hypothetical protein